jgi:hypothetical protein
VAETNTRNRIARAIEDADRAFGYSMKLTRLVDGEATYTLSIDSEDGPTEHPSAADCYDRIEEVKNRLRADAVLAALQPETPDHG